MKTEETRELLHHTCCTTECRLCEAADALEAQAREIERLQRALNEVLPGLAPTPEETEGHE